MTRLPLLLSILALLGPTLAHADAPRVVAVMEDGTDDVTLTYFSPAVVVATPETDVKRVTFSLTDADLLIRYDVVNLSHRTFRDDVRAGTAVVYTDEVFHFVFSARSPASGYAGVSVEALWLPPRYGDAAGPHFLLVLFSPDHECISCSWPELQGEWNEADNSVTVHVPRGLFAGDLVETSAWSHVILPTSTNSALSTLTLGDLVPDQGNGPNVPTS